MLSSRCKNIFQTLHILHVNFHHLSFYSTSTSTSTSTSAVNEVFTKYLVNTLGFTQQQALSTSTKLPPRKSKLNDSKFCANANSVVHFLNQLGLDDTLIKRVVSFYPRILCANVDKTLNPKVILLQDHGFSRPDLIHVISRNPVFLFLRLNPMFPCLRTVMGSDENLIKLFKKRSCFTSLTNLQNLISNVALLKNNYGVDIQAIRSRIIHKPSPFSRNAVFFRKIVIRVEEGLGIPRSSGMFLYGIYLLGSCSEKNIECKRQVFKRFGWTDYHISESIRRNPSVFWKSEENIKKKLGFLMNELRYHPDFLALRSSLFTFSLEKRMKPRYRVLRVLKEMALTDYDFYSATLKSEKLFLELLIEPFKDAIPGLLAIYRNSKGCPDYDAYASYCRNAEC